jgi:hypothetical protein
LNNNKIIIIIIIIIKNQNILQVGQKKTIITKVPHSTQIPKTRPLTMG